MKYTEGAAGGGGCSRDSATTEDVEGAKPLLSEKWKEIWPEIQSINGLYCFSQLYYRTVEQEESSKAT